MKVKQEFIISGVKQTAEPKNPAVCFIAMIATYKLEANINTVQFCSF